MVYVAHSGRIGRRIFAAHGLVRRNLGAALLTFRHRAPGVMPGFEPAPIPNADQDGAGWFGSGGSLRGIARHALHLWLASRSCNASGSGYAGGLSRRLGLESHPLQRQTSWHLDEERK